MSELEESVENKLLSKFYSTLLLKNSTIVEVVKSHLPPPPEGLRPACCLPHHPKPKGLHKQESRWWRMRESNPPPLKVS